MKPSTKIAASRSQRLGSRRRASIETGGRIFMAGVPRRRLWLRRLLEGPDRRVRRAWQPTLRGADLGRYARPRPNDRPLTSKALFTVVIRRWTMNHYSGPGPWYLLRERTKSA